MIPDLSKLGTEMVNPETVHLDQMSILEILTCMNLEDQGVPYAVKQCIPEIEKAVECICAAIEAGGKLFYVGAGTSGRLGVLDAYECPPTFGTEPELVQAILAGGLQAENGAAEDAEDHCILGASDLQNRAFSKLDVVVGIAASGRTPYVVGALKYANSIGAATIALSCNRHSEIGAIANIAIEVQVGPEILMGSTRLKSGTAQKLVLNMISTTVMVQQGKVFKNLMVDVQQSNEKLRRRSMRIVELATGADEMSVAHVMEQCGQHIKTSIVMLLTDMSAGQSRDLLERSNGWVREALRLAAEEPRKVDKK